VKNRTRTILIAAIILIAFLALLTAALRANPLGPDITVVQGIKPFSYEARVITAGKPELLERVYVVHLPFEEVVRRLDKELDASSWDRTDTTTEVSYDSKTKVDEYIAVDRGLRLRGIVKPKGQHMTVANIDVISHPEPDPRGWVIIRTCRHLDALRLALTRFRASIGQPVKSPPQDYTELDPLYDFKSKKETDTCDVTWISEERGLPHFPSLHITH